MDDNYYRAIIGCEVKVCGTLLKNLTPWHVTQLEVIGSQFATQSEIYTNEDLLLMIKVTQCQWPDCPDLTPTLKDAFWCWRLRNEKTLSREMGKFHTWLKCQTSTPKFWHDTTPSRAINNLTSPSMGALVVSLCKKVNATLSQAWNMRLSEARWYSAIHKELEGGDLHFDYECDKYEPELKNASESEKVAIAKEHMTPDQFKKWIAARRKNRKD